jgi:hypothetical protein
MGLRAAMGRRVLGFLGAGLAAVALAGTTGCGNTPPPNNDAHLFFYTNNSDWSLGAFNNTTDQTVPGTVQLSPVPLGGAIQGTWGVVLNSFRNGAQWQDIQWNQEPEGAEPPGTSLVVEVRAADVDTNLVLLPFTVVTSGQSLSSFIGRFLEVRVTLNGQLIVPTETGAGSTQGQTFLTPVLSDLTVRLPAAGDIVTAIPVPTEPPTR